MNGIGEITGFGGSQGYDIIVLTVLMVVMVYEWHWWYFSVYGLNKLRYDGSGGIDGICSLSGT